MQTRLENRLSHLKTPDAPKDLKARCLVTIPASATNNQRSTKAVPTHRPFAFPKIAAMAALMLSTAAVAAFWNTPTVGNKTVEPSGSVAFAQTVEAMKRVTTLHMRAKSANGWYSKEWFYGEVWADAKRGSLLLNGLSNRNPLVNISGAKSRSADGNTPFDRELQLPDGTIYTRKANSRVLIVKADPKKWKRTLEGIASIVTGDFKPLMPGRETVLLSSNLGNWKGQQVRIFVFGARPKTHKTKEEAAQTIRTKFYVNPATKLMIGMQTIVSFVDAPDLMTEDLQFDYQKPAPEYFDAASLRKGATSIDTKEQKRSKITPR